MRLHFFFYPNRHEICQIHFRRFSATISTRFSLFLFASSFLLHRCSSLISFYCLRLCESDGLLCRLVTQCKGESEFSERYSFPLCAFNLVKCVNMLLVLVHLGDINSIPMNWKYEVRPIQMCVVILLCALMLIGHSFERWPNGPLSIVFTVIWPLVPQK